MSEAGLDLVQMHQPKQAGSLSQGVYEVRAGAPTNTGSYTCADDISFARTHSSSFTGSNSRSHTVAHTCFNPCSYVYVP